MAARRPWIHAPALDEHVTVEAQGPAGTRGVSMMAVGEPLFVAGSRPTSLFDELLVQLAACHSKLQTGHPTPPATDGRGPWTVAAVRLMHLPPASAAWHSRVAN